MIGQKDVIFVKECRWELPLFMRWMDEKGSDEVLAIDIDFTAFTFLLQSLGKHQLPHPIDAVVTVLDGEMMRLGAPVKEGADAATGFLLSERSARAGS